MNTKLQLNHKLEMVLKLQIIIIFFLFFCTQEQKDGRYYIKTVIKNIHLMMVIDKNCQK